MARIGLGAVIVHLAPPEWGVMTTFGQRPEEGFPPKWLVFEYIQGLRQRGGCLLGLRTSGLVDDAAPGVCMRTASVIVPYWLC